MTALRKLASKCKFRGTIGERIRDQFVLRCNSDKLREELWMKDEPSLEEVLIVAKQVEHMMKCVGKLKAGKEVHTPSALGTENIAVINMVKSQSVPEVKQSSGQRCQEKGAESQCYLLQMWVWRP